MRQTGVSWIDHRSTRMLRPDGGTRFATAYRHSARRRNASLPCQADNCRPFSRDGSGIFETPVRVFAQQSVLIARFPFILKSQHLCNEACLLAGGFAPLCGVRLDTPRALAARSATARTFSSVALAARSRWWVSCIRQKVDESCIGHPFAVIVAVSAWNAPEFREPLPCAPAPGPLHWRAMRPRALRLRGGRPRFPRYLREGIARQHAAPRQMAARGEDRVEALFFPGR